MLLSVMMESLVRLIRAMMVHALTFGPPVDLKMDVVARTARSPTIPTANQRVFQTRRSVTATRCVENLNPMKPVHGTARKNASKADEATGII